MRWKIFLLERYLFGQMMMPVVTGVAGGTLLLTIGKLFNLAESLVEDQVPALDVLKLLALDMPATLVLAMPIAGMFATMLTSVKLSSNSELTAMRAAGVPFRRIFMPILLVSLAMSSASFLVSNGLVPISRQAVREIDQQAIVAQVQQEQNQDVFFKTQGGLWFFISAVNPKLNTMEDVTILTMVPTEEEREQMKAVTVAAQADWDGRSWTLKDGVVHYYDATGLSLHEEPFQTKVLDVSADLSTLMLPPQSPDELSLPDLSQRIVDLKGSNVRTQALETEWHLRFSLPLANFFAVLISLPLAIQSTKQVGRYGGVVLGILLVFVYYVILNVSRSLGEAGAITPWVAAWSHNLIFGSLGTLLMARFLIR